jgi:hypothetical protein
MFSPKLFSGLISSGVFCVAALTLNILAASPSVAQRAEPESQPLFAEFKGVRIGMTTEEARKKLGSPRDKGDEQDFYVFNDTQAVQVFYDKTAKVTAISIDYMSGATGIPLPKEILGSDAETKADGSVYKLVRYPKAGFWVSYSRTAGASPTVTVTMQKIEH